MAKCIPKEAAIRLTAAIENGSLNLNDLANKSTNARREAFGKFITDDDALTTFNLGFESRIVTRSRDFAEISKNMSKAEAAKKSAQMVESQKKLLKNYVDRSTDDKRFRKKSRSSILNRIEKVSHLLTETDTDMILKDAVAQRLGFGISEEAFSDLAVMSKKAIDSRNTLNKILDDAQVTAKKAYDQSPEGKVAVAEANKLPDGAEKKIAFSRIDIDREQLAKDIFGGVKGVDGKPLNKAEFKEILKSRFEMQKDIESLVSYASDMQRMIGKTETYDLVTAEGFGKAQVAGRLLNQTLFGSFAFGKSVVASLDFSFLFRQGWQTAFTNPMMLAKNAQLAVRDGYRTMRYAKREMGEDFKGIKGWFAPFDNNTYDFARMEVNTRANALNGMYDASSNGYGLNIFKEEQFPSSIAERIPVLGTAFKASEAAYNALALRMRADLADSLIFQLQKTIDPKTGELVNMMDRDNAKALGELVGSMTGRGLPFGVRAFEESPKTSELLNLAFFSPRFVGAQFKTLAAPFKWAANPTDPLAKLAGQKAAVSFIGLAGLMSSLAVASRMFGNEDAVDFNPASSTFGHVKIGGKAYDLTGGHGSVINLIGKGFSQRNGGMRYDNKLGIYVPTPFGTNVQSVVTDYFLNKTSPTAGAIKDYFNGNQFGEDDFEWSRAAYNIMVPLTIQTAGTELWLKPESADSYILLLAELVGVSSKELTITPMSKDWNKLRDQDKKAWQQAVKDLNVMIPEDIAHLRNSTKFQKMTREEQDKEIKKVADRQKRETVDKYLKD